MEYDYQEWEGFWTYDSSGLRVHDDGEGDIDIFFRDQVTNIPNDSNSKTSVGEYIERV